MPSRDAWGAAFCCGTGFVMRRSAIEAIGGGIPTESICEDMLTSIELKRRGLETVYLKEQLCIGLAPESVKAFFIQRQRWARGQVQILFIKRGMFGPALPFFYRLSMLPSYWLVQLPARILYVLTPVIFLLFGLAPLVARDFGALIGHLGPALIGSIGLMLWIARAYYFPILTDASGLFLALRVAPSALASLLRPFGTPFRVTTKGASAKGHGSDRVILYICLGLVVATIIGMVANGLGGWRVVNDQAALAVVVFWAVVNCVVLSLTATIAREAPRFRTHERFVLGAPARCIVGAEPTPCRIANLSLGGAFVHFGNYPVPEPGTTVLLSIPGAGQVTGIAVRRTSDGAGVRFVDLPAATGAAIRLLGEINAPIDREGPQRAALRIQLDARAQCPSANGWADCTICDASLSGAQVMFSDSPPACLGESIMIDMPDVGMLSARVMRTTENALGLAFEDVSEIAKDNLIRFLFTVPREMMIADIPRATTLLPIIAKRLFGPDFVSGQPRGARRHERGNY